MTRKQTTVITGMILLASTLSAMIAYRHGVRRGAGRSIPAAESEIPEGPCVSFTEAGPLVGKSACVTGRILRVYTSHAGNTFLDFCVDYRSCPFTSVVFSEDRGKFGDLGQLQGRQVELSGLVTYYQNRVEIIIHEPRQIRVVR